MRARHALTLAWVTLAAAAVVAAGAAQKPSAPRWVRVEYGGLVDGRRLTHSGEPVSVLLSRLGGRSMPPTGERRDDALSHRLLDPILEPHAFILADALDTLSRPADPPLVEVGSLWETGEAQPAWVELVRARRFLLESDGEGRLRACIPARSLDALAGEVKDTVDPVATAEEAWRDAWPVLRHALAGERRRLAGRRGGAAPPLSVEVHAYRHLPALGAFDLGVQPWTTSVTDTGLGADRAALDLAALRSLLDRGHTLEGARLDPSGRIRWFTSETERKPAILGRAPSLADVAVAYRAVAHGGNGEPYMSLDRAHAPHVANVNYGGRLRDTSLGWVSLLADIRFKTFSVGVDLLGPGDVRDTVRAALPEFRTHLERFASDPAAGPVLNQQTRFWFYPDAVDLTLSQEGDVLAFRRVRMSAASERVQDAGASTPDPPWTKSTVSYLNGHYDQLAALFPEMAELDESVRWLALFTWLESARSRGLSVPDLDALLATELPATPTPRRFPQLLSHNVLPPPGATGVVEVLDRTPVGEALDRLEPRTGEPLPAPARLARDQAMLSPQIPDQAALAKEISSLPADAGVTEQDLASYRAERLLMHSWVLATISSERRAAIDRRRAQQPATRVFSVGIGGVDLGMGSVIARASQSTGRLGLQSVSSPASTAAPAKAAVPEGQRERGPAVKVEEPPASVWPEHGIGPATGRTVAALPSERGTIHATRRPGSLLRTGTFKREDGRLAVWDETIHGMEGPEGRARRRIVDVTGGLVIQRWEDERFLSYRLETAERSMRAIAAEAPLPREAFEPGTESPAAIAGAAGLVLMDLTPAAASVVIRLRSADGRERTAPIPRSVLQRLVRGRELDPAPDRPLPAFMPATGVLGEARVLMVMAAPNGADPPWTTRPRVIPGEEDASRLAEALTRWWSADATSTAVAVVGVDSRGSPARWAKTGTIDGAVHVVVPEDAFPAPNTAFRARSPRVSEGSPGGRVTLLVSAEAPGVLGKRLRILATDPASQGTALAVVSLAGALRADLPASLLAEGRLGAVGVYDGGPVGARAKLQQIERWLKAADDPASKGRRIEEVGGPFTWYY